MNKEQILFVVNPVSGQARQTNIVAMLERYLDRNRYHHKIVYTQYAGHATELAADASNEYDCVVAVGGDGSVNELSKGLLHGKATMGILPYGSGNGLARHLAIPMNIKRAIALLNTGKRQQIDTFEVDGHHAINVAGVGFDAHIAHRFASFGKRGLGSYIKLSVSDYLRYRAQQYSISIDGNEQQVEAFLVSFANSSQFGNNAYIAPQASTSDGLLDLVIIRSLPKIAGLSIAARLFGARINKSRYVKTQRFATANIKSEQPMLAHIDGEPLRLGKEFTVRVIANSLEIIGNNY